MECRQNDRVHKCEVFSYSKMIFMAPNHGTTFCLLEQPILLMYLHQCGPFSTRGIPNLLAWPYTPFQSPRPGLGTGICMQLGGSRGRGEEEAQCRPSESIGKIEWKWNSQIRVYGYKHIFLGKTTEHILKCRFRSLIIVKMLQGLLNLCQLFSDW